MNGNPWYAFCAADYERDASHLSLLEHGVYRRLLDHYYSTGMALLLDVPKLAVIIRANSAEETATLEKVLAEFFTVKHGRYHQNRADREITKAKQLIAKKRKAGSEGGKAARGKSGRKKNSTTIADELQLNAHLHLQVQEHLQKKEETKEEVRLEVAQSLPKIIDPDNLSLPSFLDRSSRWPKDAVVTEDWICDGLQARLDAGLEFIELRSEAANFADYWASKPGKDAKKLDWHKTWLVWARNAKRHGYAARPSANDRFLAGGAAFIAELERAEAIGEGENNLFDAGGSSGPALLQARRSGGTG